SIDGTAVFDDGGVESSDFIHDITGCWTLYLNAIVLQFRTELRGILVVDDVHAELSGIFEVQRAIIDKEAFHRGALGNFKSDAEDGLFGLAGVQVTRAEENLEVASQMEFGDAEFVEFEWLIVDGADEIFVLTCNAIKDST